MSMQCPEGSQRGLHHRLHITLPNSSKPQGWGANGGIPTTLTARGGADHIILNPRTGMLWERYPYCDLTLGAAEYGAALYLSMEQAPRNGSSKQWSYPECAEQKLACTEPSKPQLLPESMYWSVPWTSTVHLDGNAPPTPTWASHAHVDRPNLIAAHFGTRAGPRMPKPTAELRERLMAQCKAAARNCTYVNALPHRPMRTAALYFNSTFCLQPGGESLSRKGIVDSVLLGCIPVLFHRGQRQQWPWHWGEWVGAATLTLDQSLIRAGKLDVVEALAAVPPAKVHAMRGAIRRHAHRMHYAAVDTSALARGLRGWASPDAFEVILEGAWRVARDTKLQAMGRHLQKSRKGIEDVHARRAKLAVAVGSEDDSGGDLDGFVYANADRRRRR